MAELSEQQEQNVSENSKARKSRSGLWFGIIMLLIIISVAGVGFYLFQQLRSQQDNLGGEVNKGDMQLIELSKQISGYQAQLAAIQSQLATVEADVAGKESHFTKTLADFSQLHTEKLDSTRNELNSCNSAGTTPIRQDPRRLVNCRCGIPVKHSQSTPVFNGRCQYHP